MHDGMSDPDCSRFILMPCHVGIQLAVRKRIYIKGLQMHAWSIYPSPVLHHLNQPVNYSYLESDLRAFPTTGVANMLSNL